MKITDGKKAVEIKMYGDDGVDCSADILCDDSYRWNADAEIWEVDYTIDDVIEYAEEWERCETEWDKNYNVDPEKEDRHVDIRELVF